MLEHNVINVQFQYSEDCPSHAAALERLRQVLDEEGVRTEVHIVKVDTDAQARALHFIGSPTILINGADIDPPPVGAVPALGCRAYRLEDGRVSPLPSIQMIRCALQHALTPGHYRRSLLSALNLGDRAPAFSLPGVDGKDHALSDYEDKAAVAVIFSCNHCPYVLAWEDRLLQLQADYAPKGVQFLMINANNAQTHPQDSFEQMQVRAQEKGFQFPYLRDESQAVAKAYGAQRTPEVFLFDGQGRLRYHGAIDDNYDDPNAVQQRYLKDALDAVLAGKTPAIESTPPVGCTIKWK